MKDRGLLGRRRRPLAPVRISKGGASPSQDPAELTGENAEEGRELDHDGDYDQHTGVALQNCAADIGEKKGLSASDGGYQNGEGLEKERHLVQRRKRIRANGATL